MPRPGIAVAARPVEPTGLDRRDLELVTLDPATSMDLAAFVTAGDPVDLEAHRRVETRYAPDRRIPLHPPGCGRPCPGSRRRWRGAPGP